MFHGWGIFYSWPNVDPVLCRHVTPLGHNELTTGYSGLWGLTRTDNALLVWMKFVLIMLVVRYLCMVPNLGEGDNPGFDLKWYFHTLRDFGVEYPERLTGATSQLASQYVGRVTGVGFHRSRPNDSAPYRNPRATSALINTNNKTHRFPNIHTRKNVLWEYSYSNLRPVLAHSAPVA